MPVAVPDAAEFAGPGTATLIDTETFTSGGVTWTINGDDMTVTAATAITWTTHGDDITRDRFEYAWIAERYDEVTADDWVNESANLQAVSTVTGVAGWWQGLLAGTATLTFANDEPVDVLVTADAYLAKQWWRLSVDTPSGRHVQFFGRSTDINREWSPERYARLRVTVSDFIGLNAQYAFLLTGTVDQETIVGVNLLCGFGAVLDAPGVPPLSTYTSELPSGVGDGIGDIDTSEDWEGNWFGELNRLAHSELGLIYFNPQRQKWVSLLANWWTDYERLDTWGGPWASALIGSPAMRELMVERGWLGTWGVSPRLVAERVAERDRIGQWTITGPAGESVAGVGNRPPLGSLTTFLVDLGIQDDLADALVAGTSGAHSNGQDAGWQIEVDADVTVDNMEYAARVEVADLIVAGRDPGPGPSNLDPRAVDEPYAEAVIFTIRHRWNQAAGWSTALTTDTYRMSAAAEVV